MKDLLKNKIVVAIICVVVIALVGVVMVLSKKTPEPTPQEETEEQTTVVEEIDKGGDDKIIDITSLSKDEFVALTWEQIRDFVENRLPNYRAIYGINEETTMNQEEWEKLKKVIFWQLFHQTYDSYIKVGEISSDVEIETDEWGTNSIYAEPKKDYIEGLSTSEFREYMKGFLEFAEAGSEAVSAIDILTDEQVEEMRIEFMSEYFH